MSSLSDTSRAGDKYETQSTTTGYVKHMRLKIRNVGPSDFGSYRCVAKNSLGETDGLIKLDGESCSVDRPYGSLNGMTDGEDEWVGTD